MISLDSEATIKDLDKENMLQSIQDLPDQIHDAWDSANQFVFPTHFIKANNILIVGAGPGSIAAEIVANINRSSSVPIVAHSDYQLPSWVGSQTIVIGVSYSGNDDEVISALLEAGQRGAKILGISAGGEIGSICRKFRAPFFQIHYGAQSRAALGYLLIPIINIVARLGFIELSEQEDIANSIEILYLLNKKLGPRNPVRQNPAKQLAENLYGKIPYIIAPKTLRPIARRFKNQINQSAKNIAIFDEFPELTHNTSEGIKFPEKLNEQLIFISLRTVHDSEGNSLGQNIFKSLVGKNKFRLEEVIAHPAGSLIQDMLVLILWVDYTAFYLSLLNNVDPSKEEVIEQFQRQLEGAKA